ncbi:hypothetical protein A2Z33_06195 [Candidatus Gottesmanbacteria bacterium RBG_16_52_11]|uniref:HYDIN/VesB/CFA65-like Ig-like domain-containing protein n=1 Tax=Candidatus Gottesmanbacteria bacterium RBG_16_52_11 TaxID=1798374 RepID=A0A1F5YXQ9_9BACT|nr:MAG: hypothetical protein A2Z33_06195 [Candidatus Gottesmanbacteria bacterium RBG_16_52_11]
MKQKHKQSTDADKIMMWLIGGLLVVIIILIGYVAVGESKADPGTNVVQYNLTDTEKPAAQVDAASKDIGMMSVNDTKITDFTVKNTGTKPLVFYGISSSCDCTSGQVTIDGTKSPAVSMHDKNSWTGTVNPGQSATVSVIYEPKIMPVKGDISRSVYLKTNDPANPQLTFSIKTFVE